MTAHVSESIVINAPADQVYDLVADVSRMGEWSPEATGARGTDGPPDEGERFVGFNRRGPVVWFTFCTVRAADRGAEFEFDVDFGPFPVSTWRYDFEDVGDGTTRVVETWIDRRQGLRGLTMRGVGQLLIPGSREDHNRANMIKTLRRLKSAAEG
ncbi:MAG: SRPBCC family protein [Candidatus Nanopelagicales bacterium]